MITSDFTHCTSLVSFYNEIRECHEKAHGTEYTAHHMEIYKCFTERSCKTYRELGVMQGATAACAELAGAEKLELIDIDLSRFRPYQHLFSKAKAIECSSLRPIKPIENTDVLLIDTVHSPVQVRSELTVFSPYTSRYIILHDTAAVPSIQHMIEKQWLPKNKSWQLVEYFTKNVGYTLLKRAN